MPTELGGPRGYGSRVLPHNHSFLDSVGFSDRDDLPLARARSMLYLGEDDDAELPLPLPHRNSKADLALLAQSALGPADDMTALLAEDKYDEAIRLLSDALKEDQRNQKVTVVVESDAIVAREAERGGDGAEAKQGEGLLQDSGSEERCQPEGDQEGVPQAGAEVASRQACGSGSGV